MGQCGANLGKLKLREASVTVAEHEHCGTRALMPSKAEIRMACRKRWGKDWFKVHPVIKKARMSLAAGGDPEGRLVIVHEGQETYTA